MSDQDEDRVCCCTLNRYAILNALRFVIVGSLILAANYMNREEIIGYQKYCCPCYYVSLHPTAYNIHHHTKFGLSNCIPSCTTCGYCDSYFNHTAELAFAYANTTNRQCPIGQYVDHYGFIQSNWQKETGCHDDIRISSLFGFHTSFRAYGYWALAISIFYALLVIIISLAGSLNRCTQQTSQMMMLWNIIFALILLYLTFIPFQYYHDVIPVGGGQTIICEIDSIHDDLEQVLGDFTTAGCILFIVYGVALLAICASNRRKKQQIPCDSSESTSSVSYSTPLNPVDPTTFTQRSGVVHKHNLPLEPRPIQNQYVHRRNEQRNSLLPRPDTSTCNLERVAWNAMAIFVIIFAVAYAVILVWATVLMLRTGIGNHEYNAWQVFIIVMVFVLLISSIDILFSKLYAKCKERVM
eukprot:801562_1